MNTIQQTLVLLLLLVVIRPEANSQAMIEVCEAADSVALEWCGEPDDALPVLAENELTAARVNGWCYTPLNQACLTNPSHIQIRGPPALQS
jgi:hypothetical protein